MFLSGKTKTDENNLSTALKLVKLMLNEDEYFKISDLIKVKINVDNVLTFYSFAKLYNLATISKSSFIYIENFFPTVVETQNFLQLDFSINAKILGSTSLNIHTEVEIFNAAITWLKHDSEERSKYAKKLLLKVRLPLLSEHALKYVLDKFLLFSEKKDCVKMLRTALVNKNYFKNKSTVYYTSRYCNQNNYNLLICGGFDERLIKVVSEVKQIDGNDVSNVKDLNPMNNCRYIHRAVCLKGEVYVFGGLNNALNFVEPVEKYSPSTNKWTVMTIMADKRQYFCVCAFVDKIFILGGSYNFDASDVNSTTNSCLEFDTKNKNFREINGMSESKDAAACAVFKENILVSGGMDSNKNELNTVESYDAFANKWTSMPSTINRHYCHSLVVVKDKLFVISEFCEVFDSVCMKFVSLKHPTSIYYNKSVPIGNKIFAFRDGSSSVICYDVEKNKWTEESCEVAKHLDDFSCAKLPLC